MVFWIIVTVVAIVFVTWFVRTPLIRAHRHGHGRDPGESASRGMPTSSSLAGDNGKPFSRRERRP